MYRNVLVISRDGVWKGPLEQEVRVGSIAYLKHIDISIGYTNTFSHHVFS